MMKILIAYYSWSGRTKRLANKIYHKIPNSDLLELKIPKNTFPKNMYATAEIYENQKQTNKFPKILNMPNNINDYDLILLGSPTWDWGPASPVIQFMKNIYGYQGRVVPFYTSVGNSQRFMEFLYHYSGDLKINKGFDDAYDNLPKWIDEINHE